MSEEKAKPKRSRWYTLARVYATVLFHSLCPVKYRHTERLPQEGAYILISNHYSWMDPVVNAYPIKKREVTFLGKKEITKTRLLKHITEDMHMIVVDRHNSDMEAMRACMRVLRSGDILGIYPEGTRHHQGLMEEMEEGVGLIALRSAVPIIPMYINRRLLPFHRTTVLVGEPIPTADLRAEGVNKETAHALMQRITETYRHLAEE